MRRSITFPSIVLVALVAVGCSPAAGASWTFPPVPESAQPALPANPAVAVATASVAPAASSQAGAVVGKIEVTAFDMGFKPTAITVDEPGRYAVTLANTGEMPHDITSPDGTTTGFVDAGATKTIEVDVPAAGITFICSIPGHAQAGMQGTVAVKGAAAAASPSADPNDHGGPMPTNDVAADPNA